MKYLLDFDRTLFDTDTFSSKVLEDGHGALIGTPEVWHHYTADQFLFSDVVPWLQTKQKDSLHILSAFTPSQGEQAKSFQEAKIASGGFGNLFATITVMEGLKGRAAVGITQEFPPHEKVVFVDDRLDQCISVSSALPQSHCFYIQRNEVTLVEIPKHIRHVTCLDEVDDSMKYL